MLLKPSSQFKRDLKRYKNDKLKIEALKQILSYLEAEGSIPAEYLPHKLKGKYNGYWECHIKGDFLLIWFDETSDIATLVRLGSHAELFKM